jgi:hypothetical protein
MNLIIEGVDKDGNNIASITDEGGVLNITIDGTVVFAKDINRVPKYSITTYLRIDEKSMSSSQLIALIFMQALGEKYVYGNAPAKYTNGSSMHPSYGREVVIPYYFFKDSSGVIHKEGLIRGGNENIISEFEKSPFIVEPIRIDSTKTVNEYHLRAIIHNEYLENNSHSRIEYTGNPLPGWKMIEGKFWAFFPTKYKYHYNDPLSKVYHADIEKDCAAVYKAMASMKSTGIEYVVDMRGFETRGKDLFQTFAPFLQAKLINTSIQIYMQASDPFIYPVETTAHSGFMVGERVIFLLDANTAKNRDISFCAFMNNISA